jgi:S-formylglutathione hydrolase
MYRLTLFPRLTFYLTIWYCALQDLGRQSIMGHSMGGLGSLNLFLSTSQYRSASAWAPVCNPTKSPWGIKAFTNYLKGGIGEGEKYDPSCLLLKAKGRTGVNILVDYGSNDQFYANGQLRPEALQEAAVTAGFSDESVKIRRQEGYDHSYYFVRFFP